LFAGGDTNLYGYVLGDPINWLDITGLVSCFNESDCLEQAEANYKACKSDNAIFCAEMMATCAVMFRRPRMAILCLATRLIGSCYAPCYNKHLSDKGLCELNIPIEGYQFQKNYGYIPHEYGTTDPDTCYSQPECRKYKHESFLIRWVWLF